MKRMNGALVKLGFGFLVLLFWACGHGEANLEGRFVAFSAGEFSEVHDTLLLERIQGDRFLLRRNSGFRLRDEAGKLGRLQLEQEDWHLIHFPGNGQPGVFQEQRNGKMLQLSLDGKSLWLQKREYKRVN